MAVVQVDEVRAWAKRWSLSHEVISAVVTRLVHEAPVPPFTGMPEAVVNELNNLPLRALGEVRDLFRPDLYPSSATYALSPAPGAAPAEHRPEARHAPAGASAAGSGGAATVSSPAGHQQPAASPRGGTHRRLADVRPASRATGEDRDGAEQDGAEQDGAGRLHQIQTALLTAQLDVLTEVIAGRSLPAALDELIQVLKSVSPEPVRASVLLLDADGTHLRHCSAPSLPQAYNDVVDGLSIGPAAGSCGTAAHRGTQVIVTDITTDPLWVDFADAAAAAGLRACWSTPIRTEAGALLGTFALYYPVPKQPHPQDLALVEVLVRTVAMAVQRYRADAQRDADLAAERRIALTLQHRLLPQLPAHLEGVQLHTAYRTGDAATEVGGDWYDAIAVDGTVYLVIGDVQGHDLEAVALMGQLRPVLRAYALEGSGPGEVLARASRYLQNEATERFATACVLRLDPLGRQAVVASAGHPAPLQLTRGPDGTSSADEVDLRPGLPLGIDIPQGPEGWPEQRWTLPPDATLLLYTDGVVENRSWPLAEGISRLRAALRSLVEPPGGSDREPHGSSFRDHPESPGRPGRPADRFALAGLAEAASCVVPGGQRGDDAMTLIARLLP